ncbi:hypothetical protein GCM10010211_20960 [Streptomyces albospinus]|uniref:Capsule polysaccharide biosynthesis protein n=1 Tax=Streptomyces albospinus TaxID=285515 RepID=A0ABQ2UVE7_9ACTN|nr:hypothetical protein [Streptomyces albospinus]GGU55940.1 hypothetical protein GCM10010211_20960 [Streptomyces albospinus]
MTPSAFGDLGLVRNDGRRPAWDLVGAGRFGLADSLRISTRDLEALPLNQPVLRSLTGRVMDALHEYGAGRAHTPGGADWLHVQHVPVRRLVTQVLRKLLALSAWEPFATAPGPITPMPYEGLVGVRPSSSQEYRTYTVTWSGIAYLLGGTAAHNPPRTAELSTLLPSSVAATESPPRPAGLPRGGAVALSWSSRHAETLVPVLRELARRGHNSVLIDLATDPGQRCLTESGDGVRVCPAPVGLFQLWGEADGLCPEDDGQTVALGPHTIRLSRLVRLMSALLAMGGGCTQPSWAALVQVERWLDGVLSAVQPHSVVISNDTSPLGALAVHTADRHDANTVHVQHGAWTAESVAWPALHSRDVVVMGERDLALARDWAKHPKSEVHVLGQPRFDALTALGRGAQRRYLEKLLSVGTRRTPSKIAVWACQPFRPEHLARQADLLLDGLRSAGSDWGLVIAPHPAQRDSVFAPLVERAAGLPVAVADTRVGARGCLAGADVVASAYSTCGIEAALLGVPVLELAAPGERTLGLAGHGIAQRCGDADEVATALAELPRFRPPAGAADWVCRWRGDSAAQVARLIDHRATHPDLPFDPLHDEARSTRSVPEPGEGVPAS